MHKRRNISILILLLVAALIGSYILFNTRLLIAGPQIIIQSPESGSVFSNPFIELRGTAKNTSFITLDGNQIFINNDRIFSEKLLLPPGTSIMKLVARDRFNREKEVTLWYTFDGSLPEAATSSPLIHATSTPDVATSTSETEDSIDDTSDSSNDE